MRRFPPVSGILGASLDDLRRSAEDRLRNRETKLSCCLEVYDKVELRRLLDRQLGRTRALQDPVDEACRTPERLEPVVAVPEQATVLDETSNGRVGRWNATARRVRNDLPPKPADLTGHRQHEERIGVAARRRIECTLQVRGNVCDAHLQPDRL